jgi:hypothetical protein
LGSHNWQSIRLYCLGWHERQDEIPRANTASNQWHPNHKNPIRNFIFMAIITDMENLYLEGYSCIHWLWAIDKTRFRWEPRENPWPTERSNSKFE